MKATLSTMPLKIKNVRRNWHLIDVGGQVLGRVAPEIARLLQGKNKTDYAPYLDCGDNVVVINAGQVTVTGRKSKSKIYTHYSGYPGGLRTETYESLFKKNPEKIISNAVSGMLPKNKFRSERLRRLYIFTGSEHNYKDKFSK